MRSLFTLAAVSTALLSSPLLAQFHDDFTGTKPSPKWTWTDPGNDAKFQIGPLPGHLRMIVPPGNDHTTGHGPPLYAGPKLTVPALGNFTITTHVTVNYPLVPAAKESGLMIWKDRSNNLQFKRTNAFNSQNVLFYGNLGNARTTIPFNVRVSASSLYLRIARAGSKWSALYSVDGKSWIQVGSVTWNVTGPVEVGLATSFWLWFGNTRVPALGDYAFFDLGFPAKETMSADRAGVSAAAGGTIGLAMNLGAARKGQVHLVLGSMAGSSPGIRLPGGALLPLNLDPLLNLMLAAPNSALFQGTVGLLDAQGKGSARVILPPRILNSAFGRSMRFAAVIFPPRGAWATTNAAELAIVR